MHGSSGLLGRDDERRRIADVLGAARNGRGGALTVLGEPGVGKSSLLADAAAGPGFDVVRVDGYESESAMPYAAVQRAVGHLEDHLPAIPPRQQRTLLVATGVVDGPPPDRYLVGLGLLSLEYGLFANFKPGHQDTWVDYSAERAPLLFIAGELDHIMPPSVNRSNAKHWEKSPSLTKYHEFPGRDHWTCAAPGWEAVADLALAWALENAASPEPASA